MTTELQNTTESKVNSAPNGSTAQQEFTNRYIDLIEQTFYFPQDGFKVVDNKLWFYEICLMDLVEKYGSPLRLTYLPKISMQIQRAKELFRNAMAKHQYVGSYHYAYCTKANHFSFVFDEALKNDIHLETSSSFDIDLIGRLIARGKVSQNKYVISNGFKTEDYQQKIVQYIQKGYSRFIPVLDNKAELDYYEQHLDQPCSIGIRLAAEEEPNFEFYTSRLGIRYKDVIEFYRTRLRNHPKFRLEMLHFFINTGIRDNTYYWTELNKAIKMYCDLRKVNPDLKFLNIGGGLPIKYSLGFDFDYQYMIDEIIRHIKKACKNARVPEPDIFTEFGNFTVGESGIVIFKVMGEKLQNDQELWYMLNGSLMTTLPDIWGINQRFIMLPINNWDKECQRVNIGGISCDISDYYTAEMHINQVFLPKNENGPLYLGFFNTGAYQDELSGYGGIKHCLIPSPRHVLVSRREDGQLESRVFAEEQKPDTMLSILGFD
ncbi:MAG: arginine decarboxylase [Chitinophagales bacterium]|nr:MAG: arginine decarboxylase [Chitinophagales bacterium]